MKNEGRTVLVGCRVHPEVKDEFQLLANMEDRTISQQLRRLIVEYIRCTRQALQSRLFEEASEDE